MSPATTVVWTRGNPNGFHLDSTHSSIRGERRGREIQGLEQKAGVSGCAHESNNVHKMFSSFIESNSWKEVAYISKAIGRRKKQGRSNWGSCGSNSDSVSFFAFPGSLFICCTHKVQLWLSQWPLDYIKWHQIKAQHSAGSI